MYNAGLAGHDLATVYAVCILCVLSCFVLVICEKYDIKTHDDRIISVHAGLYNCSI